MAEETPRVRAHPPPPVVMRIVNPLLCRVLQTRLAARLPDLAVLRFSGRRSGRPLQIPVGVHDIDGVLTVFPDRPWRHNFTDSRPVTLDHCGHTRTGVGILVPATPDEVGAALRTALDRLGDPRRLGLKTDRGHNPSTAELAAVGRSIIQLHLDPLPTR